MNSVLASEVDKLSADEKMHLAADLWDQVAEHAAAQPLPREHQRILDARLAAHESNPSSALSLEEFRSQFAAARA